MREGQYVELGLTQPYEEVELIEDDGGVISFLTDDDIYAIIREELS